MSRIVRFILLFVFLLASGVGYAQQYLQLGSHSYSRAPAPTLRMSASRSSVFFRAVGGVAFESVAVGKGGLIVTGLNYIASHPDGERLSVTVQSADGSVSHVNAQLYDWQLVPIAKFAKTKDSGAMTLFGELDDKQFHQALVERGGRAINYHKDFEDTLMGLRLMQADLMLFDKNAIDLPRDVHGYVLGAGEAPPDLQKNERNFVAIQTVLDAERKKGNTYKSYVTGDMDQRIGFSLKNGALSFSGMPRWVMWDELPNVKRALDEIRMVQDADQLDLLVARYGTEERIKAALDADIATLTKWEADGKPFKIHAALSSRVSKAVASVDGINPTVYDALKTAVWYGALFRHYKKHDPSGYSSFVDSLENVAVLPKVMTPTVQQDRLH